MPLPRPLGGGFDVLGADERTHGDDEEQGDNAVEPEGFLLTGGGGAHGVPSLGARTGTLLSVPFGLRRAMPCGVSLCPARGYVPGTIRCDEVQPPWLLCTPVLVSPV